MDPISTRVRRLEQQRGIGIVLRAVHAPDKRFRGRLTRRGARIIVEYRDDTPGFFWHHDILRELLDCLERGEDDVTLRDEGPEAGESQEPR